MVIMVSVSAIFMFTRVIMFISATLCLERIFLITAALKNNKKR